MKRGGRGGLPVAVVKPAAPADNRCVKAPGSSSLGDSMPFTLLYAPKYTARAGATPATVGMTPRNRPRAPSCFRMARTVARTLPTASPFKEDW